MEKLGFSSGSTSGGLFFFEKFGFSIGSTSVCFSFFFRKLGFSCGSTLRVFVCRKAWVFVWINPPGAFFLRKAWLFNRINPPGVFVLRKAWFFNRNNPPGTFFLRKAWFFVCTNHPFSFFLEKLGFPFVQTLRGLSVLGTTWFFVCTNPLGCFCFRKACFFICPSPSGVFFLEKLGTLTAFQFSGRFTAFLGLAAFRVGLMDASLLYVHMHIRIHICMLAPTSTPRVHGKGFKSVNQYTNKPIRQ